MRQTPSGLTRVYHPSRRLGSEESFLAQQLFFLRHGCVEARELEPGVWVAPGAEVHPSARLLGPVYIGQNSVVGRLACIGPGVVVDRDSWVGDRCQLADCWVRPQTMLASGRRALGDLLGEEYRPRPDWLTRGIALFLLLLTWPVLLLRPIQRRPVAVSREREELLGVSPLPAALAEVVMGRMDLLGRRPRSLSDMQRVPQDWWLTLMSTPPGLWGGHQTDEADLFFCALRGWDRWRHVLTSVL
jgi:carbonic anhydrase/acetyltransferase-like protein (isoleucine patch superfamily)